VVVKIYPHRRHVTGNAQPYLNWQVANYTTGQRQLKQFANHEAAIREAERIAKQVASGQVEAATMTNNSAQSYGRAVELLRPTGDCLELACERYARFVSIVGTGAKMEQAALACVQSDKVPTKTVKEVIDEMLAEKESRGREPATMLELKFRLARFEQAFRCPIASITKGEVQAWLDGLDTSNRNAVNYRAKVSALFNYAWRRDYVMSNPVQNTERPQCENGKVELYSPDELRKLIAGASEDFLPCLCIGAFAGLRASEILRLQWQDVRLDRLHIVASAKKRGTPSRRIVPILPNLAKWLAPYAHRTGHVWRQDAVSFSIAKQDTAQAAGVVWKHNALRHSFISYRLAAIQDTAKVALEAGNSPTMIFRHYRELVTPEQAVEWFNIAPKP
jgi:integrase/predicted DNA-binding WGR domain protein